MPRTRTMVEDDDRETYPSPADADAVAEQEHGPALAEQPRRTLPVLVGVAMPENLKASLSIVLTARGYSDPVHTVTLLGQQLRGVILNAVTDVPGTTMEHAQAVLVAYQKAYHKVMGDRAEH